MSAAPGNPRPRVDPLVLDLPAVAASLVTVRRALGRWLSDAEVSADVGGALQVALGEACANAVDHAYPVGTEGPMQVRVERDADGRVTAVVADQGYWRTPDVDPGDRGRGLLIMHQLLEDVEISRGPSGTTITLRVPARALPERATASVDELAVLEIDRSAAVPRVVATAALPDEGAAGVRLRLLEASRGGVVATVLDLTGVGSLGDEVVAVVAEVAAIGRANGWTLRVVGAEGQPVRALGHAGVAVVEG
ncbi:Anti-sigma regulatory factor (Ser/Thr protein kinase) [Klenkia soli]|uniref:Anti-sigma regulatory factor (Ser/Thr protein kinase) n=1 Tax=Klenkia soli TaxID=1052260 RepID=A0A1H0RZF3_9ACTN|nr:ATP-binding protein [Klenkia soli]SDP34972.1 Anti-sigma regulatory factor (Ser/Thr protein kinase) [Klenkia soli]